MPDAPACPTCGSQLPPGSSVCPHDGTVIELEPTLVRARVPEGLNPPLEAQVEPTHVVARPEQSHTLMGTRCGEYQVLRFLGQGGMGDVYEGLQPLIGKKVAIKVLKRELANDPEQVQRLLAEARAVNSIGHRGIVDVFGFGEVAGGRQYLVMELLDGEPLDAVLAAAGALPLGVALSLLDEVLDALSAAHKVGVVHRDIKPSNTFLVKPSHGVPYIKLLDFGLAKQSAAAGGFQSRTSVVVGTPEYMAPEQARAGEVGPSTDLYAVGVLAFEMLAGRLPFQGATPIEILYQHLHQPAPRLSEFRPEVPPKLDALVAGLLSKNAADRPVSAAAVQRVLAEVKAELPVEPVAPGQPRVSSAGTPTQPVITLDRKAVVATQEFGLQFPPTPKQPVSRERRVSNAKPAAERSELAPSAPERSAASPRSAGNLSLEAPRTEAPVRSALARHGPETMLEMPRAQAPQAPSRSAEAAVGQSPARAVTEREVPLALPSAGAKKHRWAALAGAGLVVLAGAGWVWFGGPSSPPPSPPVVQAPELPAPVVPAPVVPAPVVESLPTPSPEGVPDKALPLVRPSQGSGRLSLSSKVSCEAFLDKAKLGRVPQAKQVAPGRHLASCRNDFGGESRAELTVEAGAQASHVFAFGSGRLDLWVIPFAEVSIDGKPRGETPLSPVWLLEGTHQVDLKMEDKKVTRSIRVRAGETVKLKVNMDSP